MTGYFPSLSPDRRTDDLNPAGSQTRSRVCIVTDSTATILPSHAHDLGILVVPNRIVLDGKVYRDAVDLTAAQFYARFPRVGANASTEPVSAEDLYATYRWAFAQGATGIVSIHPSQRVSQVYAHAVAARELLATNAIEVIDSQLVGVGMWPAVVSAAQRARQGASLAAVREYVMGVLSRTWLYTVLESIDFLRRGGRTPLVVQMLGRSSNSFPILTYQEGMAVPVESVRTRREGLQRLRALALRHAPIESLLVCGTSVEWIAQMEAVISEQYHGRVEKTWLSPTVGIHTGPSVAISVVQARPMGR
jgi:DegV family protein with EDD domain